MEPPLGILSIASYLVQNGLEVEILDSGLLKKEEIQERIGVNSDIVGVSCGLVNYNPKLAEIAKQNGAKKIVYGGQYPSVRAVEILQNQPTIDAVVVGEGEEPFYQFCIGTDLKAIPNLYFREKKQIIKPYRYYSAQIEGIYSVK